MTYRCSQPSTEKIQQNTRLPYKQGADTNYCIIIRYNNKCVCVCNKNVIQRLLLRFITYLGFITHCYQ